jgi:LETM1 and EF-hand domain-containing protein 1, mitochondrial
MISSGRRRFPGSFTTSTLTRHSIRENADYPFQTQALAILLPRRSYATETSTHGGNAGGPPPGFNINEAKKPLPKEQPENLSQSTSPSVLKESDEQLGTHKSAPTAIDKTRALENVSLTELAAEKKEEEKDLAAKKESSKSLSIGQKIMKELHHYWDGTKLLATEVKISTRLALKMAAGYDLSRRENRQVWRYEVRI